MDAFIQEAAFNAASSVPEKSDRTRFSQEEARIILASMDVPFVPNTALSRAMQAAETIEENALRANA